MAMFLIALRMASHVETLAMRWQDQLFHQQQIFHAHGLPPLIPLIHWERTADEESKPPNPARRISILEQVRRDAWVSLIRPVDNPVLIGAGVPLPLEGSLELARGLRTRVRATDVPGAQQIHIYEEPMIHLVWDSVMGRNTEETTVFSGTIQPTAAFWLTALTIEEFASGLSWNQLFSRRLTVPPRREARRQQAR